MKALSERSSRSIQKSRDSSSRAHGVDQQGAFVGTVVERKVQPQQPVQLRGLAERGQGGDVRRCFVQIHALPLVGDPSNTRTHRDVQRRPRDTGVSWNRQRQMSPADGGQLLRCVLLEICARSMRHPSMRLGQSNYFLGNLIADSSISTDKTGCRQVQWGPGRSGDGTGAQLAYAAGGG